MKKLLTALAILAAAVAGAGTDGYVMLSVFSPGQIPIAQTSLNGVRLNLIYGECQNINGLDVGLFGRTREHAAGWQIGAIANSIGTDAEGWQLGCANHVEGDFAGWQCGVFWNGIGGHGAGLQTALVNTAASFNGLQLGLVNHAGSLGGLQLGLLNFIDDQKLFVFPILNAGW